MNTRRHGVLKILSAGAALLVLFLAGSLNPVALAQNLTGQIDGVVRDPSGGLITGAKIDITNLDQKLLVRSVETSSQGTFLVSSPNSAAKSG